MVQRSLPFLVLAGLVSCKGDPTGDLRNGADHLLASPSAIFVNEGASKFVVVTAVDEQGNPVAAKFSDGTAGTGVTVARDLTYLPVYDADGNLVTPKEVTAARYTVTANANTANSSVTISAGGEQITVPVRIVPTAAALTISNAAPNLGDTVTATVATGFVFTSASVVSITGAGVATVGINADSTQIKFLPGPSANNPVTVSNVRVSYAPTLGAYTATSGATNLVTSAVAPQNVTLSTAAPNVNQNVTMTAPAGFKFLPTAKVFFGNAQQHVVSFGADSSSLVFRASATGASGAITVANSVLSFLRSVPFTMPVTNTVNTGATITSLAGTDALATAPTITIPDAGKTFTLRDAGAFAVGPAACSATLGGPCRIYKFTLTAARTYGVSSSWQGTTDLGIYWANSTGAVLNLTACDAKGAGAGGQPETCTITAQAAGTYYLIVDSFAPFYSAPNNVDPTDFTVTLTGQ